MSHFLLVGRLISIDQTQNSKDTIDTLTRIAHEYLLLGQVNRAVALLDRAVPLAPKSNYDANGELYHIALEYALAGNEAQALKLIRSIKPTNSMNELIYGYKAALGLLAHQAAVANQPATVMRLINSIQDPQQRSAVQVDAVKQFVAIHAFESALQLVQTMPQTDRKVIALGAIAVGYAQAGQPEKADQTLQSALQVLQSFQDDKNSTVPVFIELASQQTAAGQPERAIDLLQQAQRSAESVPANKDYQFNLSLEIANQYSAIGQFDRATKSLDRAVQLVQSAKLAPPPQAPPFPPATRFMLSN